MCLWDNFVSEVLKPLNGFIFGSCEKPLPDARLRARTVGKFERSENLTTGYGLVG